jgi:hypothetical protein
MQKSANKLAGEDTSVSPLRSMRVSSPTRDPTGRPADPTFQHETSYQLKHNLQDIKTKLTNLQTNKTALAERMAEFESKLRPPDQADD